MGRISPEQLKKLLKGKGYHKYRAKRTWVDNIRFDSGREAIRYKDLKLCQKGGAIADLTLQPRFPFYINGVLMFVLKLDFSYKEKNGDITVEDSKGKRTPMYALKKKIIEAHYGIHIVET